MIIEGSCHIAEPAGAGVHLDHPCGVVRECAATEVGAPPCTIHGVERDHTVVVPHCVHRQGTHSKQSGAPQNKTLMVQEGPDGRRSAHHNRCLPGDIQHRFVRRSRNQALVPIEWIYMKVVVVEDDEVTRKRWVRLLNESSGYECTGEYASAEMALRRLRHDQCEVALVDLQLPGMPGIDLIRELSRRFPNVHCLVMTVMEDQTAVMEALREGAALYLLKRGHPKNLLVRLGELAANEFPLSPSIGQMVRKRFLPAAIPKGLPRFTPAEQEVLRLLALGLSNKEIAVKREVEEFTVRDHLSHIYRKLEVGNRAPHSRSSDGWGGRIEGRDRHRRADAGRVSIDGAVGIDFNPVGNGGDNTLRTLTAPQVAGDGRAPRPFLEPLASSPASS